MDSSNIYVLEIDYDNFKSFLPKNSDVSLRCKGKPLNWKEPLEIEADEEDVGMPEADISLLNIGSFVMRCGVFDDLLSEFKSDFELLPLSYKGQDYYLCNVVNVIDCLDKDLSKFNEFGGVSKIVFDSSKISREGFFKIQEDNCTSIYCTENIRALFTDKAISGAEFHKFDVV